MRTVIVIVILPLAQFLVEQLNIVRHAALIQELIELSVVNPM